MVPEGVGVAHAFELKHHHGAMSVPELESSIAWYTKMLDFQLESVVKLDHVPANVAMLRRGELRVELFEVPGAAPLPPERRIPDADLRTHGNKHVAFAVRDIDAAVDELRRRGADIVFVKKFEFAAVAFIRDNSGNLIELLQQPDLWS
jgi:methylmalonyl-CoA/ethylmalonyl-CoA epimerase